MADSNKHAEDLLKLHRKRVELEHPGLLEMLGKVVDRKVAETYGLKHHQVWKLRTELGLPPKGTLSREKKKTRKSIARKYPGILSRIGFLPDAEVAEHYGVHRSTVGKWRRSLSIPDCPPRGATEESADFDTMPPTQEAATEKKGDTTVKYNNKSVPPPAIPPEAVEIRGRPEKKPEETGLQYAIRRYPKLIAWIGIHSDEDLANSYGLHPPAVVAWRIELGLRKPGE